ncbi:MAG TPA: lysoplasmalogenase, partial [Chitinophagaceae bacterium]|nr:lysoplasmalogenase [Chitinophagaceae bacterium]
MRPTHWLWLFLLAVITDLLAIYFQWDQIRFVSKPLIVLSLLAYFFPVAGSGAGSLKAALLFSLIGDVALLFESRDPLFFMVGLGSFLLAHILYIVAFNKLRGGKTTLRWGWIITVGLYLVILLYALFPYLGELKVPVIIYAFVLCAMLLTVVHAFRDLYAKPGIICLAGALMFVLSDSLLAINKFYFGFTLAGLAIMLTYACAQYFLV